MLIAFQLLKDWQELDMSLLLILLECQITEDMSLTVLGIKLKLLIVIVLGSYV